MKIFHKAILSDNFALNWRRLIVQGVILIIIGMTVAFSCILNADAVVMAAREFSWLPLSGIIIFLLGIQECLEAFFARISREFHQNLQVGIVDTVVGALIIAAVSQEPQRLSLMVAAFLIIRGSVRIVLVHTLGLPHKTPTTAFGVISIILGLCLYSEWPTTQAWFISMSLNVEIAFRGWAMVMFALWVRKKNTG